MADKNYSKREFDHYFKDIGDQLDKQDASLVRIENQTLATNGRVSKLEWWRNAVIWFLGILWTALLILTPFVIKTIRSQINFAAQQALSDYDKIIIDNK